MRKDFRLFQWYLRKRGYRMNTETGAFKNFSKDENIPEGWVEWTEDELIEIKGGLFRVVEINVEADTIKLKGINKQARKGVIEKLLEESKKCDT